MDLTYNKKKETRRRTIQKKGGETTANDYDEFEVIEKYEKTFIEKIKKILYFGEGIFSILPAPAIYPQKLQPKNDRRGWVTFSLSY